MFGQEEIVLEVDEDGVQHINTYGVLSKARFGSLNFVVDVDIGIASALLRDYLLRHVVDL